MFARAENGYEKSLVWSVRLLAAMVLSCNLRSGSVLMVMSDRLGIPKGGGEISGIDHWLRGDGAGGALKDFVL